MTPLESYERLRERLLRAPEKETDIVEVIVQMGICSCAAGVQEVWKALDESIGNLSLNNVCLKKTGCKGSCSYEPIITIHRVGETPITYVKVTPERARVALAEFLRKDRVIWAWTLNGRDVTL